MFLWHDLLVERASYPVPSTHHQTLLSKTIFEHCLDYSQVASIALASKSIQNSSLSPNFASNVTFIDEQSAKLFETVFHPSTSLPLQFVPELTWSCDFQLLQQLVHSTKYFIKSLRTFALHSRKAADFLRVASPSAGNVFAFSALEKLELSYCDLTSQDVVTINSSVLFPGLRALSVRTVDGESTLAAVKLHHLKTLKARGGDHHLKEIASHATTLRTLVVNGYGLAASGECLENANPLLRENLTTLELTGVHGITWQGLCHLASFKNLTSLNLAHSIPNDGVADWTKFLSSFPNIKKIQLSFCVINEDAFAQISIMENLTSLNLEACSVVGDGLVDGLIEKYLPPLAPTLTELNLSNVSTSTLWLSSLASFTNLRSLSLTDCLGTNDDALRELGTSGLNHLNELILTACSNVLFKNLPVFHSVTRLDISEADVSDEKLAGIKTSFPNLKTFEVGTCIMSSSFTDIGLERISALPYLEKLNLTSCVEITNQGLKLIFTRLLRLKRLDVSYCGDGITDHVFSECLEHIRRRLSFLEVSSTKNVTQETVKLLRENCPYLVLSCSDIE